MCLKFCLLTYLIELEKLVFGDGFHVLCFDIVPVKQVVLRDDLAPVPVVSGFDLLRFRHPRSY